MDMGSDTQQITGEYLTQSGKKMKVLGKVCENPNQKNKRYFYRLKIGNTFVEQNESAFERFIKTCHKL